MRPIGIVQSLLKQERTTENRATTFRPGQIFSGKVLKLYPNQIAEVQVGSQKVIAHLETPLSVNERHWFQVQAGEGKVHLRVLETPNGSGRSLSIEALLAQLNLSTSKDNIALAQLFIKEQFPLSKDTIGKAAEWLKFSHSQEEGLEVIKLLLSKQLPFTKDVFLSLSSVLKDEPLSTQLANLQMLLKNDPSPSEKNRLLALLNEINTSGEDKEVSKAFHKIVEQWLFSNDKSNTAFNLLQKLGFIPKTVMNEEMVHQVFSKMLNNTGEQTLLTEAIQHNQSGNREAVILSFVKLINHISSNPSYSSKNELLNQLQQLITEIRGNHLTVPLNEAKISSLVREIFRSQSTNSQINSVGSQSENMIHSFLSLTNNHADEGLKQLRAALTMDALYVSNTFSKDELSLLTQMKNEAQLESNQWSNPLVFKDHIKSLMKGLGLSYEHDIVNFLKQHEQEGATKIEALKPLLMQLLSEEASVPIKDAAERLLYKITGFQVLSQEAGPIMQFAFQIPLSFSNKMTDLTMQWSGRKTEDGKIDPNYCRVLFYLQLDFLKETMVDMQVQNRIMNISIINERNDLKWIASPFIATLKESLAKVNYQLSSVSFEKPAMEKQKKEIQDTVAAIVVPNQVSGVDYRI